MKKLLDKCKFFATNVKQSNNVIAGFVIDTAVLYGNRFVRVRCSILGCNCELWTRTSSSCIDVLQFGDPVLVLFLNGQIEFPYVIGKASPKQVENYIRQK
jgi:hypothetical protein